MHACMISRFSRVRLCATLWTAAHQAPLLTGSSARTLEWVAISFSNACMHDKSLQSCPTLCDPMDSRPTRHLCRRDPQQEHWSGLPFPSPPCPRSLSKTACFLKTSKREVTVFCNLFTEVAPLNVAVFCCEFYSSGRGCNQQCVSGGKITTGRLRASIPLTPLLPSLPPFFFPSVSLVLLMHISILPSVCHLSILC